MSGKIARSSHLLPGIVTSAMRRMGFYYSSANIKIEKNQNRVEESSSA